MDQALHSLSWEAAPQGYERTRDFAIHFSSRRRPKCGLEYSEPGLVCHRVPLQTGASDGPRRLRCHGSRQKTGTTACCHDKRRGDPPSPAHVGAACPHGEAPLRRRAETHGMRAPAREGHRVRPEPTDHQGRQGNEGQGHHAAHAAQTCPARPACPGQGPP